MFVAAGGEEGGSYMVVVSLSLMRFGYSGFLDQRCCGSFRLLSSFVGVRSCSCSEQKLEDASFVDAVLSSFGGRRGEVRPLIHWFMSSGEGIGPGLPGKMTTSFRIASPPEGVSLKLVIHVCFLGAKLSRHHNWQFVNR